MDKQAKQPRGFERRQFLRGAGGAWLMLPFLPSLLPRSARAQAAARPPKKFIYVGTEHGGGSVANTYGTQGTVDNTSVEIFAGNTANYAPLALTTSGANASLSPILTASSSLLTSSIAKKMNVLRGVDFANHVGHQDGCHLGNNSAQVGDRSATFTPMVTIDQLMAYSPNFYTAGAPRARSVNIGGIRTLAWTYTNPTMRTGVQKLAPVNSSLTLFKSIFGTMPITPTATRPLIIDRVREGYRSLRESNRRLSAADKIRLDDHVARLTQLQQTFGTTLTCTPTAPQDNFSIWGTLDNKGVSLEQHKTYYKLMADVLLTAFSCGASRISVFHSLYPFSTYQGDWHQDIAHQDEAAGPQATLAAAYQQVFEFVFMYLVKQLDSIAEADGTTALDNSLVYWGQESGYLTHAPYSNPIVMAGSAGGYFKTGMFVDYRNQIPTCQNYGANQPLPGNFSGLVYPQFLATALYSMGIAANEWTQPNGLPGYGDYKPDPAPDYVFVDTKGKPTRSPSVIMNASRPMPIITAG
jgi:hypothetical protein